MAYKRRQTYKKRQYKRKPTQWYNQKHSVGDMGYAAWQGVKYLKGLVNSEVMKKDTTVSLGAARTSITQINALQQDNTQSGRTGNSVLMKSVALKGSLQINTAVTVNTRIMIALIMDTQQVSDTVPTLANIFTTANDPQSFLNVETQGRFKILKRWQYILTPASGGRPAVQLDYFKKFYMTHARYNGTGVNDIQKNGLYLGIITTEDTNFPTVTINARLNYHDN